MIYLITGIPGSSKTLNVIKMVCENPDFKNRVVYYHRIKELTLPWIEIDKEQVIDWESLPDGSIIVIDEAQYIFPTRDPKKPLPEFILNMSEHRHRGFDFFLITQSPMLLDAGLRRFVGKHIHIERVFGMKSAKHYMWEKCQSDVDDHFTRKDAVVRRVAFDKKYFGVYKSAEVHTHKTKIPFKVFAPFILLFALIMCGYLYYQHRMKILSPSADTSVVKNVAKSIEAPDDFLNSTNTDKKKIVHVSTEEYLKLRTPRLADVPSSAPIYDELTTPKSFPKPSCVLWTAKDECKCYSQQGTRLEISKPACMNYVKVGYFDSTKPDSPVHMGALDAVAGKQAVGAPLASAPDVSVTRNY